MRTATLVRVPGVGRLVARVRSYVRRQALAAVREPLAALQHEAEDVGRRLRDIDARLAHLDERLVGVDERLDVIGDKGEWSAHQLRVLTPQVSGLEARVEDLRESVESPPVGAADAADVMDALARIRTEHRRVSARMAAISHYEERLRRLEGSAPQSDQTSS